MKRSSPNSDALKNRLFAVLVYLTPLLLLLVLELTLRLFNYGGDQRLFVTGPEKQISHYWMCGQEVGKRYFFMQNSKPSPPKDLFLKTKPDNGYRIFVMGGSTAAGFPYGYNLMFSRILNKRLSDIFPDRHIEVVNTAMSAVNSYTLLDLTDEILDKQPDAILIYAGHNEFYGALGVGSTESLGKTPTVIYAYLKLKRFKTFLLVRDLVGALRKGALKMTSGSNALDPSDTLMARIVAEQAIPYKSDLYNRAVTQYRENLRRIFAKAQKKGVPIIISELVSNITDQPPFVSVAYDTFPPADTAYQIGRKLLEQGQYQDAKAALTYAKDLDALRFRAAEEMNKIIREVAAEFNAPVVPMKDYFEAQSAHGLIGNELILEHLHPNTKGYFIMADAFMETMKDNRMIRPQWDESRLLPLTVDMDNWGVTELDTACANLSIRYLKGGWPFKPAGEPNRALEFYTPVTKAESLSVRILVNHHYSPVVGHVDMAKYYEKRGEYDKALREYRAAYYSIPFELQFYEGAVQNLLKLNRPQEALEVLQTANRYGYTPLTDKWTGILLSGARPQEALPYLERALQAAPNDKQIAASLLLSYQRLDLADKAAALKERFGDIGAGSVENERNPLTKEGQLQFAYTAMMKQGQAFLEKKDYRAALQFFRRAHGIHPSTYTYKWIGMLELAGGNLKDGEAFLSQAHAAAPEDFEIAYNLCHAYIKLNRKADAERMLRKMEALRPQFRDPHNLRGQIAKM